MNIYIKKIADLNIKSILKDVNETKFYKNFDSLTDDIYKEEVAKIIYDFCSFTYSREECIRYYIINDILLYQPEDFLIYLKRIWEYALKSDYNDDAQILSYFINSLYYSYTHGESYKMNDKNNEQIEIFTSPSFFPKRYFYSKGVIYENCLLFAYDIMKFAFSDYDNIHKLDGLLYDAVRIASKDNKDKFAALLNDLVSLKSYYNEYLINYDENIEYNYQQYFDFELNNASQGFHNDYFVLNKLYETCEISAEDEGEIVETLEKRVDLISSDESPIRRISQYESVINEIVRIRSIRKFEKKYELKKLQNKASLLKIKSTKSINDESFHTFEQKIEIPQEHIEEMELNLKSDILLGLYKNCMVNFEQSIESCIKTSLSSPLSYLASTMYITNKEEGIYETDNINTINHVFKEHYTSLINQKFKESESKYDNPHIYNYENAYSTLLNYMKNVVSMHTSLCVSLLYKIHKKDIENVIVTAVTGNERAIAYNNYYILLMPIILGIERFVLKLFNHYENKTENIYKDEYLGVVFKNIIERNSEYANTFMYLNFVLYDDFGLRTRNRIAHGNYKCDISNLDLFVKVVVSWICASAVCSEVVGKEDE